MTPQTFPVHEDGAAIGSGGGCSNRDDDSDMRSIVVTPILQRTRTCDSLVVQRTI
jgi:hypothetical protein